MEKIFGGRHQCLNTDESVIITSHNGNYLMFIGNKERNCLELLQEALEYFLVILGGLVPMLSTRFCQQPPKLVVFRDNNCVMWSGMCVVVHQPFANTLPYQSLYLNYEGYPVSLL